MALDIQTIAMTADYVPYERPPQPFTLWSAIPRGLQSFLVATEALDVKAINDQALLKLQATLPPNFAYVMGSANATITQNKAAVWDDEFNLNLQNFYRAPNILSGGLAGNWRQQFENAGQNGESRSLVLVQPWPSFPIIGSSDSGIAINMEMFNNDTAASTIGTVNAYISFWQFDLEQVRKYPINSPQPVHAR